MQIKRSAVLWHKRALFRPLVSYLVSAVIACTAQWAQGHDHVVISAGTAA